MRSITLIFAIVLFTLSVSRPLASLNGLFDSINIGDTFESVVFKTERYCESNRARCDIYDQHAIETLREDQRARCDGELHTVFVVSQIAQTHDIWASDVDEFYRNIYIGPDSTVCDKEAFSLSG